MSVYTVTPGSHWRRAPSLTISKQWSPLTIPIERETVQGTRTPREIASLTVLPSCRTAFSVYSKTLAADIIIIVVILLTIIIIFRLSVPSSSSLSLSMFLETNLKWFSKLKRKEIKLKKILATSTQHILIIPEEFSLRIPNQYWFIHLQPDQSVINLSHLL